MMLGWLVGLNLFNAELSPKRLLAGTEISGSWGGGGGGGERETIPNATLSPPE